jgi:protein subunit release factor A
MERDIELLKSQIASLEARLKQKQDEQKRYEEFQERADVKHLNKLRAEYEAKGKQVEAAEDAIPEIKNRKILCKMEKELEALAKKGGRYFHVAQDHLDPEYWGWDDRYYTQPWNRLYGEYIEKTKEFGLPPKDYMSH